MTTKSDLLLACKALLEMAESGVTSLGTIRLAREVIARAESIGSVTATETVLDEEQVGKFRYYRFPTDEAMVRAIEQAVLQSEQVQRWKRDTERIYDIENERILVAPEYQGGWYAHVFENENAPVAKFKAESFREAIDAAMEKQP